MIEEEEVFLVMAVSDEDVVNITSSVTVTITDITTGKYWVHVLLSLISLLVSILYNYTVYCHYWLVTVSFMCTAVNSEIKDLPFLSQV